MDTLAFSNAPVLKQEKFIIFHLILVLAIFIGVYLRISHLDLIEFKSDEFMFLKLAYQNMQSFGSVLSFPATSFPIRHPPLIAYVLIIPIIFSTDPMFVSGFISLLNIIGILIYFLFLRHFFDKKIAYCATALLATSPWGIIFSRKIWNPDIIFPFFILFCYFFFLSTERKRPRNVILMAIFLAIAMQTHILIMVALLLAIVIFFLLVRTGYTIFNYAIIVFIVTCFMGPYIFDAISNFDFTIVQTIANKHIDFNNAKNLILSASDFSSGLGFEYLIGKGKYHIFIGQFMEAWPNWVFLIYRITLFISFGYIIFILCMGRKHTGQQERQIIAFFLILVTILLGILTKMNLSSVPHYFVIFLGISPLFIALFLVRILPIKSTNFSGEILVLIFVITNIVFMFSFYSFIDRHKGGEGDYGFPYKETREIWDQEIAKFSGT